MKIPGMGKRAATELLDTGDVTWEGINEMLGSIDFTYLDRPARLNPGMTKAFALGLFAGTAEGRQGPIAEHEYLLARNMLREFGPLSRKVTS